MGVSHSGAELGAKLKQASSGLKAAEKSAVQSGGRVAQRVFMSTQSGMHAASPKAPVRVRNTESNGHPAVAVGWRNAGWVRILEGPVQAHFIGPRGRGAGSLRRQNLSGGMGRKSARSGRMLLSLLGNTMGGGGFAVGEGSRRAIGIPGVGPRAWAMHPGYGMKKPFARVAMAAAPPLVKKEMAMQATRAFAQPFK